MLDHLNKHLVPSGIHCPSARAPADAAPTAARCSAAAEPWLDGHRQTRDAAMLVEPRCAFRGEVEASS